MYAIFLLQASWFTSLTKWSIADRADLCSTVGWSAHAHKRRATQTIRNSGYPNTASSNSMFQKQLTSAANKYFVFK